MAIKLSVGNENANLHVNGDNANLRAGGAITAIKNYSLLTNKPQINGVELVGNKSFEDLGLEIDATPTEDSENAVSSGGVYDALEGKEDVSNKVTSVDSSSTDDEYPSAKAVYDLVGDKPYLKCVGYWYLFTPSNNHATLEIVNGTSLEEALKQPAQVYVSMNDYPTPDYIGQSLLQINDYEDDYIVVFPQSIQWRAFLYEINCGGAKFKYNSSTHLFTFKSFIEGTELKDNKVQEIPVADTDHDYASNQYPSIRAIRKMFDDLHTEMETEASATKTLVDLELDENGDLVPTFDDIPVPVQSVNGKTGAVTLNASDVGALPNTTQIPTNTSELYNDSGFVNATEAANAAPVQSVNGKTGAVTLDSADVGALPDTTSIPTKTSDLMNDGSDSTSTYVEADELAAVATSGSYNDLQNKPSIPAAQVNADWSANSGVAEILNKPAIPAAGIPSGGNAGQILKKNSATDYDVHWADQTQYYPSGYSTTGADKQTKQIACSSWTATAKSYLHILLTHANTYAGKLYFTVNAVNTYEVWINGAVSSATNYSLPAGTYIIYFDGSAFQVRTDGIIPASINGTAARIPYGECNSTSTSTAFTATVPGITELKDGVTMLLYNGVVTSASGFTININGLGAKPSYSNMAMGNSVTPTNPSRDTTIFNINYAFLFVYSETLVSGGCWIGYRGYDANTNTIGYQLRTNNTTMPTADKFYRYRLLFTSADGTKWVPANTSTSTNTTSARTPNTRAIDPFGEIVWYGTTTVIEANANVTATQLWQEYYGSYTNIGYSFNNTGSAATMTAALPIYIKCTPQADGSAIIDPTTPYTQSLPSTDDGKIYIYLGRAYNATNFEITMKHPVYYHDGTGIRLWTGVKQIPVPPSTDGTYTLQCVVNNGTATYSWI